MPDDMLSVSRRNLLKGGATPGAASLIPSVLNSLTDPEAAEATDAYPMTLDKILSSVET